MKTIFSTALMALTYLFASAAGAQTSQTDVVILDVDQLSDRGKVEAQIVETNLDERTLTVRLEPDNEFARLLVPQDAEIVQMGPNNLAEREMEFSDFHAGDRIQVEGVEIEGVYRLRIIGIE